MLLEHWRTSSLTTSIFSHCFKMVLVLEVHNPYTEMVPKVVSKPHCLLENVFFPPSVLYIYRMTKLMWSSVVSTAGSFCRPVNSSSSEEHKTQLPEELCTTLITQSSSEVLGTKPWVIAAVMCLRLRSLCADKSERRRNKLFRNPSFQPYLTELLFIIQSAVRLRRQSGDADKGKERRNSSSRTFIWWRRRVT